MAAGIERIAIENSSHLYPQGTQKGTRKGTQKGTQQIIDLRTFDKTKNNNNLGYLPKYVTVKQGTQLTGIPIRTLQDYCKSAKLSVRQVRTNGGWGYEIELNSLLNTLPAGKRAEVLAKFNSGSPQSAVGSQQSAVNSQQSAVNSQQSAVNSQQSAVNSLKLAADMTNKQREIMLARADFLALYSPLSDMSHGSALSAKKDFLAQFNTGIVYPLLYKILGDITYGTAQRWEASLNNSDKDITVLAPGYGYKTAVDTGLTAEEKSFFLSLLLSPKEIKVSKAYQWTKFHFEKQGKQLSRSYGSFIRFAEEFKKQQKDVWTLMRKGEKALKENIIFHIQRDISQLNVGDVWVADGKTTTFDIINPWTGRPQKATFIAYMDWKSLDIAGWELMMTETTQSVTSALRNGIIRFGKKPKICYQDNGKAFKNKYFKGSAQFNELGWTGLFGSLGIIPVYSGVYNAPAKIIEVRWKEMVEGFERLTPSFTGTSPVDKPAYMMRNEKYHKHQKSKVKILSLRLSRQKYGLKTGLSSTGHSPAHTYQDKQ